MFHYDYYSYLHDYGNVIVSENTRGKRRASVRLALVSVIGRENGDGRCSSPSMIVVNTIVNRMLMQRFTFVSGRQALATPLTHGGKRQ